MSWFFISMLSIVLILIVSIIIYDIFFSNNEDTSACTMEIQRVQYEIIDGHKYTHCLSICHDCGYWEVKTVRGEWYEHEFKMGKTDDKT